MGRAQGSKHAIDTAGFAVFGTRKSAATAGTPDDAAAIDSYVNALLADSGKLASVGDPLSEARALMRAMDTRARTGSWPAERRDAARQEVAQGLAAQLADVYGVDFASPQLAQESRNFIEDCGWRSPELAKHIYQVVGSETVHIVKSPRSGKAVCGAKLADIDAVPARRGAWADSRETLRCAGCAAAAADYEEASFSRSDPFFDDGDLAAVSRYTTQAVAAGLLEPTTGGSSVALMQRAAHRALAWWMLDAVRQEGDSALTRISGRPDLVKQLAKQAGGSVAEQLTPEDAEQAVVAGMRNPFTLGVTLLRAVERRVGTAPAAATAPPASKKAAETADDEATQADMLTGSFANFLSKQTTHSVPEIKPATVQRGRHGGDYDLLGQLFGTSNGDQSQI